MYSYKKITPQEGIKIYSDNCYLLDVRSPAEFKMGHLPFAINLPYYNVDFGAEVICPSKDKTVLIYCDSGLYSKVVAHTLSCHGYCRVYDMGGIAKCRLTMVK